MILNANSLPPPPFQYVYIFKTDPKTRFLHSCPLTHLIHLRYILRCCMVYDIIMYGDRKKSLEQGCPNLKQWGLHDPQDVPIGPAPGQARVTWAAQTRHPPPPPELSTQPRHYCTVHPPPPSPLHCTPTNPSPSAPCTHTGTPLHCKPASPLIPPTSCCTAYPSLTLSSLHCCTSPPSEGGVEWKLEECGGTQNLQVLLQLQ